ncbi:MAG: transposase [Thaumarchaeota archaeon]|nr:transposase [Nitrososphaerota archaeon]
MVLEPNARTERPAAPLVSTSDTNSKIAALVKLITKEGPQITQIARELGVHKETARYWYKERLLKRGYTFAAVPNHERLGLRRVVAFAEFSEEFKPYGDAILMAMNELAYLTSFMKALPEDLYSIHANVPQEHANDWIRFMHALKQRGVFSSIHAVPFEWARVVPMRSEIYDFEHDAWQYDWASKPKMEPGSLAYAPSTKSKFDSTDLNMIKQLQIDPNASLIEIGDKLQVNYKTLTWHYRKHLIGNGLIKGYMVNWTGTRYDPKLERALHRRHRYMWLELMVSGVTETERMELMAKVNQLPFVWFEAGGQNYFAQIAFPMETMTEALSFVKDITSSVRQKASWHFMDQANALRFSIAPNLYDQETKKWKFDQMELLSKFDGLALEIKGMTS